MAFGSLLEYGTENRISDVIPLIPNCDWGAIEDILENEATVNNLA